MRRETIHRLFWISIFLKGLDGALQLIGAIVLFLIGNATIIRGEADMDVCGEAASAEEAITAVTQLRFHLAIVDISLGGANGIELIKNIKAVRPSLPVLVLSMHDESHYAERALRAGGDTSPIEQRSDREVEVLTLLGKGLSSREISERLHLSQKTVDSHRTNLKEKLNLKSAPEFVKFAFEWVSSQES